MNARSKQALRRYGTILLFWLGALGAAFAEPRTHEHFAKGTCFSLDFREGVVVKNASVKGYAGRVFNYGDKCVARASGRFCIFEKASGVVAAKYKEPPGGSGLGECPKDTQTSFEVQYLEQKLLTQVRQDEEDFLKNNFPAKN